MSDAVVIANHLKLLIVVTPQSESEKPLPIIKEGLSPGKHRVVAVYLVSEYAAAAFQPMYC